MTLTYLGGDQMRFGIMKGQGATEYLVLLAVVLIIALVAVALLSFYPGMASDAQATESQIYWKSASPIAITEWAAMAGAATYSVPYLRIRNTGAYPIRITMMLGGSGYSISQYYYNSGSAYANMSDVYYMAPGEEKYFGYSAYYGTPSGTADRYILFTLVGGSYAEGYLTGEI